MDELNYFCRDKHLSPQLTVKLRTFFQNTQHVIFARAYDDLLQKMSPLLRGEAALRVAAQSIARLPYFSADQVESGFLATAALKMKTAVYSLREYVPIQNLTIIERGIAAREGRLRVKGTCIGHDMILELAHLRDVSPVIALTIILQVMTLSREDLGVVLIESPRATELVRKAAFKLAFHRLVNRIADEYRMEKARDMAAAGGGKAKVDFLKLSMPAAVKRAHERAMTNSVAVNTFGSPAFAKPMPDFDNGGGADNTKKPEPPRVLPKSIWATSKAAKHKLRLMRVGSSGSAGGGPSQGASDDKTTFATEAKLERVEEHIQRVEAKVDQIVASLSAMAALPHTRGAPRRRRNLNLQEPQSQTQPVNAKQTAAESLQTPRRDADTEAQGVDDNDGEWELKSRGPKLLQERPPRGKLDA